MGVQLFEKLLTFAEALFNSHAVGRFRNIERVARRKLLQLHAATELNSLRVPPGNSLNCTTTARTVWKLWITTETELEAAMAKPLLDEIHPGEILLEEFMKPMGITGRQLAADMDVPPSRISDIVNGARPITADTALRLGLFFSMEPRQSHEIIAPRIRVFQPVAT